MKKIIDMIGAAGFLAALGIVGTVEHGADLRLMWWILPCVAAMVLAAAVEDRDRIKKFLEEGIKTR